MKLFLFYFLISILPESGIHQKTEYPNIIWRITVVDAKTQEPLKNVRVQAEMYFEYAACAPFTMLPRDTTEIFDKLLEARIEGDSSELSKLESTLEWFRHTYKIFNERKQLNGTPINYDLTFDHGQNFTFMGTFRKVYIKVSHPDYKDYIIEEEYEGCKFSLLTHVELKPKE